MLAGVLKKIRTDQLRLGMFLHELSGSWMDHPFWRSRFVLKDPKDLQRVLECGIAEAVIDTSRGLDVEPAPAVAAAPAVLVEEPAAAPAAPAVARKPAAPAASKDAYAEAARICNKSKAHVRNMFEEARMGRAVDAESCLPVVDEITISVMRNPGALITVARLKTADEYTYMHSVAVCALMVALARQLGFGAPQVREAGLAGMLHDTGKALVPMELINKAGKLTDEEFAIVRRHPELGHELLSEGAGVNAAVLDACLHHHEKVDGSGYPHRLSGDTLTLLARMCAVCDVYDAVTSRRSYKTPWDPGDAIRKMAQWNGHFDPKVFQAFVKSVGIYPVGTVLRLQSQRLGVVVAQGGASLLAPRVRVFYDAKARKPLGPLDMDLADERSDDRVVGVEPPEAWNFGTLDPLWLAPTSADAVRHMPKS